MARVVFNALMAMITLHVLAVLYYLAVKRQNLIGAMVTGRRRFTTDVAPMRPGTALRLLIGVVISAAITWAVAAAG